MSKWVFENYANSKDQEKISKPDSLIRDCASLLEQPLLCMAALKSLPGLHCSEVYFLFSFVIIGSISEHLKSDMSVTDLVACLKYMLEFSFGLIFVFFFPFRSLLSVVTTRPMP